MYHAGYPAWLIDRDSAAELSCAYHDDDLDVARCVLPFTRIPGSAGAALLRPLFTVWAVQFSLARYRAIDDDAWPCYL